MASASVLTIEDYVSAYRDGRINGPEQLQFVWQAFDAQGCGPNGDTAIIYLPTDEQRQTLIDNLLTLEREKCPLWGVPFVVKDNIDICGWPTTAACPEFAYTAGKHASVVQALLNAGAIPVAKANLDQFATGLVGTRSPYGWVRNAFSDEHISGGSSSGSAVVVAKGLVPFALGTDTAGSGRVPAGFNNVVGTKPTPGRFGMQGVVPACRTIDCVSIMSLTVQDAAKVSAVLSGSTGINGHAEPQFHDKPRPRFAFGHNLRVGVPADRFFTHREYQHLYDECIAKLQHEWSVSVVPIDMSKLNAVAQELYRGPWLAERYMTAHDCLKREVVGLDPTVKTIVSQGEEFTAVQAFEALYQLKESAADIENIWQNIDVLCVPTAPGLPTYQDVQADPIGANSMLGTYTNFVNLLGWAALATPAAFTSKGLPFGVTWVAPGGCDDALLELGARWTECRSLPLGCQLRSFDAGASGADSVKSASHAPDLSTRANEVHQIAVVGAHLSGMPLNGQLQAVGARLNQATTTSQSYRLFHIPNTTPPKPGLVRVQMPDAGKDAESEKQNETPAAYAIAVEVYDVPTWAVSSFLAQIPSPLGLGKIELADGRWITGFICEPWACQNATDISHYGGWRAYMGAINQ